MFEGFLDPKSVAVIGATERSGSVGRGVIENLKKGRQKIYFVNPSRNKIFGKKSYARISDIKEDVDLAVIVVPKKAALSVAEDCVEKNVKGAVVISSGFSEEGKEGVERQKKLQKIFSVKNIPFIGPNCLGIIRPPVKLNASFAPGTPKNGGIAFISQSGGLIDALIDGTEKQKYGFSLIVSVGNAAGLDLADYIGIAERDKKTKVIVLYIEGVKNGRKFFDALKKAKKPILVLKAGKTKKSSSAISSHTGSLAGDYKIFSSVLTQGGAFEFGSVKDLFSAAKAISWQTGNEKDFRGLGIVTNGGGAGVLLTDLLYDFSLPLAKTKGNNPLDILGDASSEKYEKACREMLKERDVSVLVVMQTPQIVTSSLENAKVIARLKKEYKKPIVAVFMGEGKETREAVDYLEENKVPSYTTPRESLAPLFVLLRKKGQIRN